MSRHTAPEDLLVHARRDRLDDEDERRLELSLNASRELSLLYEAGIGFDAEASLLPGDEARASRLVEQTLQVLHEQPARRAGGRASARYFALSVACGVLLSVAAASAWQYASDRWLGARSLEQPSRAAPRSAPVALPSPVQVQRPPAAPLPSEPLGQARVSASASARERSPAASASAAPSVSARELFTRAGEARRGGDAEGAIALYEELGRRYPDSVEAHDARLLLGNLRLEQRPRAALNQFESYGGGPLSLEALWGKAEALRKLNSPSERAVLEQLLRDYPASPYAVAAKKRLEQLAP